MTDNRFHAWLVVTPSGVDEFGNEVPHPDYTGVQKMISYANPGGLAAKLQLFLYEFGAKCPEATAEFFKAVPDYGTRPNHRTNQVLKLLPTSRRLDEFDSTGLLLQLFPCHHSGTNIDVDPVEPRGE